jgi:NAD(P)-dependent dehydrogenase (short-subunit alcohol dehydrogenase family)
MSQLTGKVALVTGAAKGIGQGIARQLACKGAAVVIADIDVAAGKQTLQELLDSGARASFTETNIVFEAHIEASVAHAKKTFGGLDILVNNAGVNSSFDATEMSSQAWDEVMAIDLKGAWLCAKHAIPEMLKRGGGTVINIASVHATQTTYHTFPYAVAKSGLLGLTRNLALDWGDKGIRAVTVSPGWVLSDAVTKAFNDPAHPSRETVRGSIPAKFIGEPDDVGHLVAFLTSDEARYITGTEIVIDGGISARFALS